MGTCPKARQGVEIEKTKSPFNSQRPENLYLSNSIIISGIKDTIKAKDTTVSILFSIPHLAMPKISCNMQYATLKILMQPAQHSEFWDVANICH